MIMEKEVRCDWSQVSVGNHNGRQDQTGIVSGARWRADGMWPERTLAFTTGEMGRQWRLLKRTGLGYVARNNPCDFFLLLKHPEATKKENQDPSSAIDGVFTTNLNIS